MESPTPLVLKNFKGYTWIGLAIKAIVILGIVALIAMFLGSRVDPPTLNEEGDITLGQQLEERL